MPTSQQECSDILERVRVSSYYIGKLLNDAVQQNRGNTLRVYHDAVQQNRGDCICRLPARNKSTEIFLQNGSV